MNKRGFTLIEVLLMTAILGIVLAIVLPGYLTVRKSSGLRSNDYKEYNTQEEVPTVQEEVPNIKDKYAPGTRVTFKHAKWATCWVVEPRSRSTGALGLVRCADQTGFLVTIEHVGLAELQ